MIPSLLDVLAEGTAALVRYAKAATGDYSDRPPRAALVREDGCYHRAAWYTRAPDRVCAYDGHTIHGWGEPTPESPVEVVTACGVVGTTVAVLLDGRWSPFSRAHIPLHDPPWCRACWPEEDPP